MHEHLETIIADLYELDPTLRERDHEVRALVSILSEANPTPQIDEAFVSDLRTRLFAPRPSPFKAHHSINWWMIHLAPVGAIAIVTLVLVPTLMNPVENGENIMLTEEVALEMDVTRTAKEAGAPPADTSLMQIASDALPPDSFMVSTQLPGDALLIDSVTLTTPGFVAVHTNARGELGAVVGTSTLLSSGTSGGIPVPLSAPAREGETYYAVLYHDNGDGIFTREMDAPVLDPVLGVPQYILFTIAGEPTQSDTSI